MVTSCRLLWDSSWHPDISRKIPLKEGGLSGPQLSGPDELLWPPAKSSSGKGSWQSRRHLYLNSSCTWWLVSSSHPHHLQTDSTEEHVVMSSSHGLSNTSPASLRCHFILLLEESVSPFTALLLRLFPCYLPSTLAFIDLENVERLFKERGQ